METIVRQCCKKDKISIERNNKIAKDPRICTSGYENKLLKMKYVDLEKGNFTKALIFNPQGPKLINGIYYFPTNSHEIQQFCLSSS